MKIQLPFKIKEDIFREQVEPLFLLGEYERYEILAKSGDAVIGKCTNPIFNYQQKRTSKIKILDVDPNFQRRGMGTKLVLSLEMLAFTENIFEIFVTDTNELSSGLLKNMGYFDVSVSEHHEFLLDLTKYQSFNHLMQERMKNPIVKSHFEKYLKINKQK